MRRTTVAFVAGVAVGTYGTLLWLASLTAGERVEPSPVEWLNELAKRQSQSL